ncbi:MFS transporter, partial [Burkholderia pseudomallei]
IGAHQSPVVIVWRMALCCSGFVLFQSPNNRAILSSAPRERAGGASVMLGTARITVQKLGAALVAQIFRIAPQHVPTNSLYA